MNEEFKDFLKFILGVILVIVVSGFIVGLCDAEKKCLEEQSRIVYLIPSHRLGCYLGAKPSTCSSYGNAKECRELNNETN